MFANGLVNKLLGVTFVETTEAYLEASSAVQGNGATTSAQVLANSPNNRVARPIIEIGADAIVRGTTR